MNKLVVNEDNYKRIVLKRMIIVCWILLAICFGIKLFGGNFFSIVCTNETFIKVCSYLNTNKVLYYLIGFITFYISTMIYFLGICQKSKFTKFEFLIATGVLCLMYSIKFISLNIAMITDTVGLILIPMLFRKDKIWKRLLISVIGFFVLNAFQMISLFIKNLGIKIIDNNILVSLIFSIDYYIMLVLFYLYRNVKNKKEI